jgi:holo-[acyl-carrier protein] synthase
MAAETIKGIGVDLVETNRIEDSLKRWGERFTHRIFTHTERAYCEATAAPARHYAGRFAVKEAVSKAFGTGIGDRLNWLDMEVCRNTETGAPRLQLSAKAAEWAATQGIDNVWISLSHTHQYAVAQAILTGPQTQEHST